MKMKGYNGWTNRETWLVALWYSDMLPLYFSNEDGEYPVDGHEVREAVEYIALETEAMSLMREGLLMDFINHAFHEVNWDEIADALNQETACC